jgi:hypothetical protein
VELVEEKEDNGRGLWKLGVLPSAGRKCAAQEGAQQPSDWPKRSGPLVSTSRKEQEKHTEEEIISHQISLRYPSAVG